jgi:hypothetical protein
MHISGQTQAYWGNVRRTNVKRGTRDVAKSAEQAKVRILKGKQKRNGRER